MLSAGASAGHGGAPGTYAPVKIYFLYCILFCQGRLILIHLTLLLTPNVFHVLQDMADAGGDMAAGMEMGGDMAAAGADAGAMMAAMTPAMSMSFLLPGIGLGLLKGLLFGKIL